MTILHSIILGIVQGLTEFLPISSSAHLVLVPYFLGWTIPGNVAFVFDVLVQLGTLLAVIIYFWKDLVEILVGFFQALLKGKPLSNPHARMGWYLIVATIPAGIFGLLVKSEVEAAFSSAAATGFFLLLTAGLLFLGERFSHCNRSLVNLGWLDSIVMGIFQAISIFPGVSRSGSTITGGMLRNLDRESAARFSFLMSIPIMIAASLVASLDMVQFPNFGQMLPVFLAGFLAAMLVGYLSIRWLLAYLTRHSFNVFAVYVGALGLFTIAFSLLRG